MVQRDCYSFHRDREEGLPQEPRESWCAADQPLNQLVELERDLGVSAAGSRDLLLMTTQKNALLHQGSAHLILLCCVHDVVSRFCDGTRRTEDSNAEGRCNRRFISQR